MESENNVTQKEKPIFWARWAVNHTKKVMLIALLIPVLLGFVAFRFGGLEFSPPGGGRDFLVRNDERTEQIDAFSAAIDKYAFDQDDQERADRDFAREFKLLVRSTKEGSDEPENVDLESEGANVFTREGLAFLKSVEDNILSNEEYKRFCLDDSSFDCDGNRRTCALPVSITNHPLLYGIPDANLTAACDRKAGSEPVSAEVFEQFKKSLVDAETGEISPIFSIFFGKDFKANSTQTQVMRSFIQFGTPIANTTSEKTDSEKQSAFEKWAETVAEEAQKLTNDNYHMYVDSLSLFGIRFNPVIFRDLSFSLAAIVAVFIIVVLHTTSPFLATITIIQVVLSFPISLFVYSVVFRITYFATLQVMTIFLILGIGADDVFVFTE